MLETGWSLTIVLDSGTVVLGEHWKREEVWSG
jgi:hypothetical protein